MDLLTNQDDTLGQEDQPRPSGCSSVSIHTASSEDAPVTRPLTNPLISPIDPIMTLLKNSDPSTATFQGSPSPRNVDRDPLNGSSSKPDDGSNHEYVIPEFPGIFSPPDPNTPYPSSPRPTTAVPFQPTSDAQIYHSASSELRSPGVPAGRVQGAWEQVKNWTTSATPPPQPAVPIPQELPILQINYRLVHPFEGTSDSPPKDDLATTYPPEDAEAFVKELLDLRSVPLPSGTPFRIPNLPPWVDQWDSATNLPIHDENDSQSAFNVRIIIRRAPDPSVSRIQMINLADHCRGCLPPIEEVIDDYDRLSAVLGSMETTVGYQFPLSTDEAAYPMDAQTARMDHQISIETYQSYVLAVCHMRERYRLEANLTHQQMIELRGRQSKGIARSWGRALYRAKVRYNERTPNSQKIALRKRLENAYRDMVLETLAHLDLRLAQLVVTGMLQP